MATCDAAELLSASSCFTNKTGGQLQVIQTVLLCRILQTYDPMATCDPQELLNAGRCFNPYIGGMLQVIITQLLCEILNGGSTTGTCITCVDAEPIAPSTCDCAICYGQVGSAVAGWIWLWDSAGAKWDLVLS